MWMVLPLLVVVSPTLASFDVWVHCAVGHEHFVVLVQLLNSWTSMIGCPFLSTHLRIDQSQPLLIILVDIVLFFAKPFPLWLQHDGSNFFFHFAFVQVYLIHNFV